MRYVSLLIAISLCLSSIPTSPYVEEKGGIKLEVEDFSHSSKADEIVVNGIPSKALASHHDHPIKLRITNVTSNPLIVSPHSISLKQHWTDLPFIKSIFIFELGEISGISTVFGGILLISEYMEQQRLLASGYHPDPDSNYWLRDEGANKINTQKHPLEENPSLIGKILAGCGLLGSAATVILSYYLIKQIRTEQEKVLLHDIVIEPGEIIEKFIFVGTREYNKNSFTVSLIPKNDINNEITFMVPWKL